MSKAGVEAIQKKLEGNLEKAIATLAENRFTATSSYDIQRQYFLGTFTLKNIYIPNFVAYVDNNSSRLAFAYLLEDRVDFLDFSKITGYEVIAVGKTKGVSTGAVLGGQVGLGLGAGFTSSSTEFVQECTKIAIKLTLDDLSNPAYEMTFYDSIIPLHSKVQYYTAIMEFIEKFKPVLDNIIRINQQGSENRPNASGNVIEELKSFKELLDCGVITQEEFDAKKKQLLGL